jgi:hypothetical protein
MIRPVLRIRDVYPRSRILIFDHPRYRITDPKRQQKRGVKKNFCPTFFIATNITKLKITLFFKWGRKKNLANLQRITERFTQKIDIKLSKISVWDPGSRGQEGTGSRIRNTGYGSSPRLPTVSLIGDTQKRDNMPRGEEGRGCVVSKSY